VRCFKPVLPTPAWVGSAFHFTASWIPRTVASAPAASLTGTGRGLVSTRGQSAGSRNRRPIRIRLPAGLHAGRIPISVFLRGTGWSSSTSMENRDVRNSSSFWRQIKVSLLHSAARLEGAYILFLQRELERLNFDRRHGIMCMFERREATYAHPLLDMLTGEHTDGSISYR
jgi:hypothetical protein